MIKNPLNRPVELVFRLVLGGLFVATGISKAMEPILFLEAIRNYRILGDPWAAWTALCLPWLEIFAGIALIFRILYSGALLIIIGSLFVFMGAVLSLIVRGIDASCGCYGKLAEASHTSTIILQVSLLMIALALAFLWWREQVSQKPS